MDFISVDKEDDANWDDLLPQIQAALIININVLFKAKNGDCSCRTYSSPNTMKIVLSEKEKIINPILILK